MSSLGFPAIFLRGTPARVVVFIVVTVGSRDYRLH